MRLMQTISEIQYLLPTTAITQRTDCHQQAVLCNFVIIVRHFCTTPYRKFSNDYHYITSNDR